MESPDLLILLSIFVFMIYFSFFTYLVFFRWEIKLTHVSFLMWHAFRKHEGEVVGAGSGAQGISCFGWEVR